MPVPAHEPPFPIRPARSEDAPRLTALCEQLGYPSSEAAVRERLAELLRAPQHALFVAESAAGEALAWVHVFVGPSLVTDRRAQIGGLVVDAHARGHGLGRRLMEQAERWAREQGCGDLSLRSNIVRTDAHAFYTHLGYETTKQSLMFVKRL